jgi:hypothetical protein
VSAVHAEGSQWLGAAVLQVLALAPRGLTRSTARQGRSGARGRLSRWRLRRDGMPARSDSKAGVQ